MAVLAAPLPVALILLHSTASNFNSLSCPMRKSPTECRVGGRTGRECLGGFCDRRMNVKNQWEGVQNSGKISTDVRGRDMGVEEGTGK